MRWFLLFLLACGIFRARAESPEALLKALPPNLADCERGEFVRYGDARLGVSREYQQPGVVITVYAYDLGKTNITDGTEGEAVRAAFQAAKDELKDAEQKGIYKDVVPRESGTVEAAKGVKTLRARFELTRQKGQDSGLRCCSELDVLGAHGLIVKLRVTSELANAALQKKTIEKFLPALLEALNKPAKPKPTAPAAPAKSGADVEAPTPPNAPRAPQAPNTPAAADAGAVPGAAARMAA